MRASIRLAIALGAAAAFALSGCVPSPSSSRSVSPSSSSGSDSDSDSDSAERTDAGAAGGVSFAGGASLPADVEINLGDSLASDPGWNPHPEGAPGRWAYVSADESCTAAFRQGLLGAEPGMDDLTATDALMAAAAGRTAAELEPLLSDGRFLRHGAEGEHVEHRQFSLSVDGSGVFFAARAFVAPDYSVEVTVKCQGADVTAVAAEVLSKTQVEVVAP